MTHFLKKITSSLIRIHRPYDDLFTHGFQYIHRVVQPSPVKLRTFPSPILTGSHSVLRIPY